MREKQGKIALDYFKIIAAILVIAIHTSPLTSFHELPDFILTRIWARVAVPFFFMITGYFIIPKCKKKKAGKGEIKKYLRYLIMIYGCSILLYLPINWYSGYWKDGFSLLKLIQDILFNGTFYHLWYLPAAILGTLLVVFMIKVSSYRKSFFISLLLYAIGLFGDSYYGLILNVNWIKACYETLFSLFEYTRNGIFFAPVFLLLGYGIYLLQEINRREHSFSEDRITNFKKNALKFLLCFSILHVEALILHYFKLQRHDSMYLFLVPSMYYLFQLLLPWEGTRNRAIQSLSLLIYILHPLAIILVRGIAKLLKLQKILIENSFIHFIAVVIVTVAICYGIYFVFQKRRWRKS